MLTNHSKFDRFGGIKTWFWSNNVPMSLAMSHSRCGHSLSYDQFNCFGSSTGSAFSVKKILQDDSDKKDQVEF